MPSFVGSQMRHLGSTFLEKLLRSAGEGVLVLDGNRRITHYNPAACRILGLDEASVIGSTLDELEGTYIREDGTGFPPMQFPAYVALRTGQACHDVTMGLHRPNGGSRVWITVNADILPARRKSATRVFVMFNDITAHIDTKIRLRDVLRAREQLFRDLEQSEARMRSVLQTIPSPVWLKNLEGVYLSCNAEFERFFNATEKHIIGKTDFDLTTPEAAALFQAADQQVIKLGETVRIERWVTYASDQHRAFMSIVKLPVRDSAGTMTGILGIAHDMTEKKQAEDRLNGLMAYKEAIVTNAPIGLAVYAADRHCNEANPAYCEIFGYTEAELIGKTSRILFRDDAGFEEFGRKIWSIVARGGTYTADLPMRRHDGSEIWARTVVHLIDIKRPDLGVIVIVTDITAQKTLELDLQHSNAELQNLTGRLQAMARTDPLTELANRRAFIEAAEIEFLRCKRFKSAASVLLIDIDHFKKVNDTYGHEIGDRGLVALASTLKGIARATDMPARFGGEEFVMLLSGTDGPGAVELAERIRGEVAALSIPSGRDHFGMTVSIGVASFEAADDAWSEALARADAAMYRAKALGRNRVVMADPHRSTSPG